MDYAKLLEMNSFFTWHIVVLQVGKTQDLSSKIWQTLGVALTSLPSILLIELQNGPKNFTTATKQGHKTKIKPRRLPLDQETGSSKLFSYFKCADSFLHFECLGQSYWSFMESTMALNMLTWWSERMWEFHVMRGEFHHETPVARIPSF
jgi:hypothetical protein